MMGIAGTLNDPNDYSRVLMNVGFALVPLRKEREMKKSYVSLTVFHTVYRTIRDQHQRIHPGGYRSNICAYLPYAQDSGTAESHTFAANFLYF